MPRLRQMIVGFLYLTAAAILTISPQALAQDQHSAREAQLAAIYPADVMQCDVCRERLGLPPLNRIQTLSIGTGSAVLPRPVASAAAAIQAPIVGEAPAPQIGLTSLPLTVRQRVISELDLPQGATLLNVRVFEVPEKTPSPSGDLIPAPRSAYEPQNEHFEATQTAIDEDENRSAVLSNPSSESNVPSENTNASTFPSNHGIEFVSLVTNSNDDATGCSDDVPCCEAETKACDQTEQCDQTPECDSANAESTCQAQKCEHCEGKSQACTSACESCKSVNSSEIASECDKQTCSENCDKTERTESKSCGEVCTAGKTDCGGECGKKSDTCSDGAEKPSAECSQKCEKCANASITSCDEAKDSTCEKAKECSESCKGDCAKCGNGGKHEHAELGELIAAINRLVVAIETQSKSPHAAVDQARIAVPAAPQSRQIQADARHQYHPGMHEMQQRMPGPSGHPSQNFIPVPPPNFQPMPSAPQPHHPPMQMPSEAPHRMGQFAPEANQEQHRRELAETRERMEQMRQRIEQLERENRQLNQANEEARNQLSKVRVEWEERQQLARQQAMQAQQRMEEARMRLDRENVEKQSREKEKDMEMAFKQLSLEVKRLAEQQNRLNEFFQQSRAKGSKEIEVDERHSQKALTPDEIREMNNDYLRRFKAAVKEKEEYAKAETKEKAKEKEKEKEKKKPKDSDD